MATLLLRGDKFSIRFTLHGQRKLLAADTTSERQARRVLDHVEAILKSAHAGGNVEQMTAVWLATACPPKLRTRMAKVGLIVLTDDTENAATLGAFVGRYIKAREADAKPNTLANLRQAERYLVGYFGADKPLGDVTPGDADEYRRSFQAKVGDNTARRHLGRAKQFFRVALRKRLIAENPFGDMKGLSVQPNKSREYFVDRATTTKVLKACIDNQWKLLVGLARYAGLRTPSESLALVWGDVDFERNRLRIRSVKTEHHEGHAERVVPLFPELKPLLDAALNEFLEDFDPKQNRLSEQPVITRYRDGRSNLRTQLERAIRKAGLTPWPRLWQNLRASLATELAAAHPAHVAAAWLGHSTVVAQKHYWQVTDADFEKAITVVGTAAESAKGTVTTFVTTQRRNKTQTTATGPRDSQDIAAIRKVSFERYPRQESNL